MLINNALVNYIYIYIYIYIPFIINTRIAANTRIYCSKNTESELNH